MGDDTSGSDSVQCVTDLTTCCATEQGPDHRGNWFFPNETRLPFTGDIFEDREALRVDLRRMNSANSPVGIYRCGIPTAAVHNDTDPSVRVSIYMGLYTETKGQFLPNQWLH